MWEANTSEYEAHYVQRLSKRQGQMPLGIIGTMGFLKRMLASVGIGSAKIDTVLHQSEVRRGDYLSGVTKVQAGQVSQIIEHINLYIMTHVEEEEGFSQHAAAQFRICGEIPLQPNEFTEVPFEIQVPYAVPLSLHGTRLWLNTGAAISAAVDPGDQDMLTILPDPRSESFLGAMKTAGFVLRHSEVEYGYGHLIQEIGFVPSGERFRNLKEVEVVLTPQPKGLEVVLEVDRRARGIASFFATHFEARSRWLIDDALFERPSDFAAELERRLNA
ncbi:MAG: sporulation protein [Deinococcaceae bacterium]